MKITNSVRWDLNIAEAKSLQLELRSQVRSDDCLTDVRTVAGVDVSFDRHHATSHAAVAILSFPDLELIEHQSSVVATSFPYVPGYLSFREIPPILSAFEKIETPPDLILCDGHGYAHPRRFGLACHLGVITDLPSIGVAKSRLIGEYPSVAEAKGRWAPLSHDGEVIGAVLRSRERVKPVYVSIGHRITLPSAVRYVLACTTRYRLPETTRWADRLAAARS